MSDDSRLSATAAAEESALATLAGATRDLVRDWRTLAGVEVFVVLVTFVVLTPMTEALLRMLVSRSGSAAVTDVDIAFFFLTTKSGLAALLLLVAASLGLAIFGQACLMTVGLARSRGTPVRVRDAVTHGAARAVSLLWLTLVLVRARPSSRGAVPGRGRRDLLAAAARA